VIAVRKGRLPPVNSITRGKLQPEIVGKNKRGRGEKRKEEIGAKFSEDSGEKKWGK